MSWQIELPLMGRTLIHDWDDQPVYRDERLAQVIVVAAKYVQIDVELPNEYVIDIANTYLNSKYSDAKRQIHNFTSELDVENFDIDYFLIIRNN
jgi:hypothetical protein